MPTARLVPIAAATALVAMLGACANPTLPPPGPVAGYPPSAYPAGAPAGLEFGRVTNIQLVQAETAARGGVNVPGAVIGGVAGAVIGNQVGRRVGSSGNRDTATVLGGVAGAAVGSQVGQPTPATGTQPVYRVTVQTDRGVMRVYDVPTPGDLRVGDRVRVDQGVIYRG